MKAIRLLPVRHEAPVCESYDDVDAVRRFEKAVRVHRAHAEAYTVIMKDNRVDGAWQVQGASGTAYVVDLVDGSGRHDTCSCPDFLTNELGTCKHLEAVRRALAFIPGAAAKLASLGRAPAVPTLTVNGEGGIDLAAVGRWTEAQLRGLGLSHLPGTSVVDIRPDIALRPGLSDSGIRVVHAVVPAAEALLRRRSASRRREALKQAFAEGRLGVDVLRLPLFPYQVPGVMHLAACGRAVLGDDMGLGKTVQAIAACELLRARGEAQRAVIVTTATLKDQWAKEIEKFTGRQAVIVGGGPGSRAHALASDAPYKILSYELTWREVARLSSLDADVLILDEAQRAHNFRTRTAAALRAIPSRFLFVLTGTPIENRLDELYTLMQLVDPAVLGPLWKFNLCFHKQGPRGKILGCKNLALLRERIGPVVMRRRKDEVESQLPPLTEQTRYTALTPEQAEQEQGLRSEAARYMAIADRRPLTPQEARALQATLLKARQVCNALELCDPELGTGSPKLDEFEALMAELADQGTCKVLVFSEWIGMLNLAAARLDRVGLKYAMLTGDIPAQKRPALLDRFRQDPDIRVLLSTDAGGVGLNLQVANYVVHLDLPWNPARLDQRTARAHRHGQTRGVLVTYLCSERGIERGIEATLAGKRAVRAAALDQDSTVDELEGQSFSLFLKQMKAVFEKLAEPGKDLEIVEAERPEIVPPSPVPAPEPAPVREPAPVSEPAVVARPEVPAPAPAAAPPRPLGARAANRLALARVVLDAGFHEDAVVAAYDALSAALADLLPADPPRGHAALVAALYRDLLPSGRVPMTVAGILARLHDLTALREHGVDVPADLATGAVAEAGEWVTRLKTV